MIHFPSPQIVAQWFSGFVVGVVFTLIASGVLAHTSRSPTTKVSLPPPRTVANSYMLVRCRKIARIELGSLYPDHRLPRLVKLDLMPASPVPFPAETSVAVDRQRSIYLAFRLNDHPLGKAWRFQAAKADVFGLMKAYYTSGLPIYNVVLVGTFPLPQKGTTRESQALVAYMSHDTAETIPWKKWDRTDESRLWSMLSYRWVDPRFG